MSYKFEEQGISHFNVLLWENNLYYSHNATNEVALAETILVADDDPVERRFITALLTKRFGYTVITAQDGHDAVNQVQSSNVGEINAVLLDIEMPNMDGINALKVIRKYRPDLPVLILTSSDDTSIAVTAIKEGASDFIVKPAEPIHLNKTIKDAIRLSVLSREMAKMKRNKGTAPSFVDLIGHNAGLKNAIAYGRKAAVSDVAVLITGETGVGKELFARIIHSESKRASGPFVAINCNTIQEHLIDSILFSHDKGAFRKAESGTIFLDDIGALPQEAQVRILHLLQHREIEPASGGRPVKVNVRVISAAEGDIVRNVQSGRLREDLYFQLNIMPIRLPPLRERQDDIVPLAEFFIERLSILEGLLTKTLDKSAKQYLIQQAWPGNVRELENLIHRTLVLSDSDVIDDDALVKIHETGAIPPTMERRVVPSLHINLRLPDGRFKTLADIETETLHMVLKHFDKNITRTAEALGVAKSTFYRKIKS